MIYRTNKKNNKYVQVDLRMLNDNKLSMKAKGLLTYMLSMKDDWLFREHEVIKHFTDGKASYRSAMQELVDNGYVEKQQVKKDGKWSHTVHSITEIPADQYSVDVRMDDTKSATNYYLKNYNQDNYNNIYIMAEHDAIIKLFLQVRAQYTNTKHRLTSSYGIDIEEAYARDIFVDFFEDNKEHEDRLNIDYFNTVKDRYIL